MKYQSWRAGEVLNGDLSAQRTTRSPGLITRGFFCFYAALASVGVGAGGVVEAGIVASIGTTFPFPIRLAEFHAAKIFGSSAAALFT